MIAEKITIEWPENDIVTSIIERKKLRMKSDYSQRVVDDTLSILNETGIEVLQVKECNSFVIILLEKGHQLFMLSEDPNGLVENFDIIRPNYYIQMRHTTIRFLLARDILEFKRMVKSFSKW